MVIGVQAHRGASAVIAKTKVLHNQLHSSNKNAASAVLRGRIRTNRPPKNSGHFNTRRMVTKPSYIRKKAIEVPNVTLPRPQQKQFMPPINPTKGVVKPDRVSIMDWLKNNSGAMVLNFGSVCLLVAFTRTDMLELRTLAMTGSLTNVIYFATRAPINYLPMTWSSIFVATNMFMLYQICDERTGSVHLSENQQRLYEEHFLPHGVTPKQFQKVLLKATRSKVPADTVILQQGEKIDTVTLVYKGGTKAMTTAQRRVTAASSEPTLRNILVGGNAGAWIGEIHFLEALGARDTNKSQTKVSLKDKMQGNVPKMESIRHTFLTYATSEESTLLQWSFDDLASILDSSADMRCNMTRAMTAAVVGKVVNYTVEKSKQHRPKWVEWLTGGSTFQHPYGDDGVQLLEEDIGEPYTIVDDKGEYEGSPLHLLG